MARRSQGTVPSPLTGRHPPYRSRRLWLENVSGKRTLDWVKAQDRTTVHALARSREFSELKARFLRALNYYENVEGGHAGASNNEQRAFMSALYYEFLWDRLGAVAPRAAARAPSSRWRKHPTWWSLTIPTACMNA